MPEKMASGQNILFWRSASADDFFARVQVMRNKALAGPKMGIQKVAAHETLPDFYVFTYEARARLYVAEKDDDTNFTNSRLFSKTSGVTHRSS